MFCSVTQVIQDAMLKVFRLPELVTVFISVLPIVEARGAIPIAFGYGIKPVLSWLYAFIGSSLMAPVLIAVLLPFVKWLSKTKLFKKVGETIYEKFEQKSRSITDSSKKEEQTEPLNNNAQAGEGGEQAAAPTEAKKSEKRKMLGVFAFVAIPLPLTGVWTGSAVAAITKLSYPKALAAVVAGNLVASGIITLLCYFFEKYINIIILAIGIIAIAVVIFLIIKIILHKSPSDTPQEDTKQDN